jgi:thymidylate kinase
VTTTGQLIAVDGVNGAAVVKAARAAAATIPRARRGGVSGWDASGLFGDLMIAPASAGAPSARTLVLLYAADLAFRLRWEIRPAIHAGKTVVAAPYIATAIAFGRAAELDAAWLHDLFGFANTADERLQVRARPSPHAGGRSGFVEFARECLEASAPAMARNLAARAVAHIGD